MNEYVIEPLSKERISDAKALVDQVFPYQHPGERASFPIFSGDAKLRHRLLFAIAGIELLNFWVAISPDGRIDGISGLYSLRKDRHQALWLGWFAVHPDARGRGLGNALLMKAIDEARKQNAVYLRLYTSDSDLIEGSDIAQMVYERHGLSIKSCKRLIGGIKITKEEGVRIIVGNKIIRELKLT